MDKELKVMDINKFVDQGYLQEANRLFFHPLGLSLEVSSDEDVKVLEVIDHRDNQEGVCFDVVNKSDEEKIHMKNKVSIVNTHREIFLSKRIPKFGFIIEPIE